MDKKILKQHQVISHNLYCFKNKKKKGEIIFTFPEENLLNCVRHTFGFIQTYFLFNLLIKLSYEEINFQRIF